MQRCIKELGLAGIQIGSNINGKNLNDESLFTVFEAASDLNTSIFIHPWDIMGKEKMEESKEIMHVNTLWISELYYFAQFLSYHFHF